MRAHLWMRNVLRGSLWTTVDSCVDGTWTDMDGWTDVNGLWTDMWTTVGGCVDGCGRMWTDMDGCGRICGRIWTDLWPGVDGYGRICGRTWTDVDGQARWLEAIFETTSNVLFYIEEHSGPDSKCADAA